MLRALAASGRLLRAVAALAVLAGFTAGVPWLLTTVVGWPLDWIGWPHLTDLPGPADLYAAITTPWSDEKILGLLATCGWVLWLQFCRHLVMEILEASAAATATRRGRPRPPAGGRGPIRWAAAVLVGAIIGVALLDTLRDVTGAPSPAAAADTAAHTAAIAVASLHPVTETDRVPATTGPCPAAAVPADSATSIDLTTTPLAAHRDDVPGWARDAPGGIHHVVKGDNLWDIADAKLGDPFRWREIYVLNRGQTQANGYALTDPDMIHIGWVLALPTHEKQPDPPPAERPSSNQVDSPPTVDPEPSPTPKSPATSAPAPSLTTPSGPTISPTPSENPSAAAPDGAASPSASTDGSADASAPAPADDDGAGVQLPDGSWVTWTLATAITAAAALVWLQRRRRFTIDTDADDPPTELPPPVTQLRRAVAANPDLTLPTNEADQAAAVPELAALPAGGIGLQGDGAHAAARAALVSTLASGGPHHPDRQGQVVIEAATLTTLAGSDAAALHPWPRLHIADTIDDALTVVEAQLLHRARILDEHALSDLDTLRQQAPYEEALPPILLVAESPPPSARMRTKVSLALGAELHLSAVLLGEWEHGPTIDVTADGHTTLLSGQPAEPLPPRLPVLPADTALHILNTLHEAHTGQPPAAPSTAAPVPLVASGASKPTPASEPKTPTAETGDAKPGGGKARLYVLGPPRIEDITKPGRDLRGKARELAVYLACHPDGASTREIGEYLEPDARLSQADQRVHTNASNLRHNLARAGSVDAKNAYLIKSAGRYRLDPATVEVDIWRLRDLLRNGSIATGERRHELLTQACALSTHPLAEGQDYEWITPHREAVRRWGTEAHLLLAEDLMHLDPQATSDLLDKAIGLDRYNEALYRKAMHARHALGDADGIRTLLRALTKSLADLDAEPEEQTTTLATQLRTDLERR